MVGTVHGEEQRIQTEINGEKSANGETGGLNSSLNSELESPTVGKDVIPKVAPPPPFAAAPTIKKAVFAHLPIVKLWFVLILTFGFTVVLLVASHLTHSLTLRIEAYHALYNVLALVGCLFTMKMCQRPTSIKNTFGWARVELLSCLCTLLFIAALCFSVALESAQTAGHAGHQDAMHHPLPVIALGGIGLCLNAIVFCLIGGYTHHQGCFLERRSSGVWIQRKVPEEAVQAGMRTLLSHPLKEIAGAPLHRSYEGVKGIFRDISGLTMVMICAAVVYWDTEATVSLYVDPAFAILSACILLFLSFPYGKECCEILLQTIPGNIDVHSFSAELLQEFPEVVNIHHLHIWSFTPQKVVATAHVVYSNPKVYRNSIDALEKFFREKDIKQVTLQPEFVHYSSTSHSDLGASECLLSCINALCRDKECCADCSNLEMKDGVSTHTLSETKSPCSHGVCRDPGSRKVSVCSEHHGTSAYRNSRGLPNEVNLLPRKSRSKEDLRKTNVPALKISRSYSFHLLSRSVGQPECFHISEKK